MLNRMKIKNRIIYKVNGTDLLFLVICNPVSGGKVFREALDSYAADVADRCLSLHFQYQTHKNNNSNQIRCTLVNRCPTTDNDKAI